MLNFGARASNLFKKAIEWWSNASVEEQITPPEGRSEPTTVFVFPRGSVATIMGLRHYWRIPVVEWPVLGPVENRLRGRIDRWEETLCKSTASFAIGLD